MSINIPVLLLGRAFATQNDDSPRDTQRASVLPALLPNPFVGMMMAAVLAKRDAQEPKAVVAAAAGAPKQPVGAAVNQPAAQVNPPAAQANQANAQANQFIAQLNQVIAEANQATDKANQAAEKANQATSAAAELARAHKLVAQMIPRDFFPTFIGLSWPQALRFAELVGLTPHTRDDSKHLVVVRQHPIPGEDWLHDTRDVHLTFGARQQIGL